MLPGADCLIRTHGGAGGGLKCVCLTCMKSWVPSPVLQKKKKRKCAKRVSISATSVLWTQCICLCWESRDIILRDGILSSSAHCMEEGEDVASVPLTLFKRCRI